MVINQVNVAQVNGGSALRCLTPHTDIWVAIGCVAVFHIDQQRPPAHPERSQGVSGARPFLVDWLDGSEKSYRNIPEVEERQCAATLLCSRCA